jgi:DNA repair protein SbcC/Rad50
MKILAIRGRNLASLARSFEVDLANGPLAGVGLFAITGPVGAGKSTLLDALCLALFDRTPRLSGRGGVAIGDEASDDGLRSNDPRTVLRRDAAEGHAEVDFTGRDGVRYRARWSVRRARRRIDGRVQDQEMSLEDLDRAQIVASGRKTEVLAAIEARLGLDFAQFGRSVLLAQGDFAAFLRASADERARLLENLTGADLYRRLSRAAHEKRRLLQNEMLRLEAQAGAQVLLAPERRADLEQQVRRLEHDHQVSGLAVELAQRYVTWYVAAAKLLQQENAAVIALQSALDANSAAAARRQRHAQLVQALPLVPRAELIMDRQRRLAAATGDAEAARRELEASVSGVAALRARQKVDLAAALQCEMVAVPPLLAEFVRWKPALERWSRAHQRQTQLQAQLPVVQAFAANAAASLEPLRARLSASGLAQREAGAALQKARDALARPEFGTLAADRRQLAADRAALREREERLAEWQRRSVAVTQAQDTLGVRQADRDRLARGANELRTARELAERRVNELRQEQERLRARVAAAALREHLVDGAPCPLCGALEHPAPAAGDDRELLAAQAAVNDAVVAFDAARELERTRHVQRESAAASVAEAEQIVRRCAAAEESARTAWFEFASEPELLDATSAAAWIASQRDALRAREVHVEELGERLAALQAALERASDADRLAIDAQHRCLLAVHQATEGAEQASRAVLAVTEGLARAAEELAEMGQELAPALDGVPQWEDRLRTFGAQVVMRCQGLADTERKARAAEILRDEIVARRAKADEALAAAREDLRLANEAFEAALLQANVRPMEVREAGDLGQDALSFEGELLRELESAVTSARAVVKTRTEFRRSHDALGRPEIAENDAAAALEDARAARERVQQQLTEARTEIGADDLMRRMRDEIAPRLQAAEEAMQVWAALDDLIGSSHGDAFAVFAQSLTLDLLLAEANRRLREIARRYQLQKNHGAEMDFVVVDLDLGGTRRGLQTLSGGETFLVSLALALALATLAAPRSRVETLFLDEGFGTLDAHHLEQALGALDSLQAAGCQVGIISHVDGIAERIGASIEVLPEGSGQSRVRVAVR